ncbi:MmyB family transcriptional regulator [Nocardia asiatica]|uniref:MmyB family transcriptional regulator n=1 Tax=Nocardia asiatica TaxID=209252 RepID=UPI0012F7158B|nr:helix-turn-helix domain-containing protein [Nocardia asiatica]
MSLLGKTMRQCRNRANITRDQLAPKAFITSSALEKWESGERLPTLDKLKYWFDALRPNDLYREKILSLSNPALFELQLELAAGARRFGPTAAEIRQLELLPFPACVRTLPTYDLIAANSAFRRLFPGLAPAPPTAARPTNIIEWMVLSPLARSIIQDWYRHTHVLVNALQILAPGVVAHDQIEALVASCNRATEFHTMWTTDVTTEDIHNTELTVLDRSRSRWIPHTTSPYRAAARGTWELFMMTPVS